MTDRSITVGCAAGLSNRLMVLISGLAIARESGRAFRMLWPRSSACSAGFAELFANPWDVRECEAKAINGLADYTGGMIASMPDLLENSNLHVTARAFGWLVLPWRIESHERLQPVCEEIFGMLRPSPEIERRIAEFKALHFKDRMIGVHLRRGGFRRNRPDIAGNTREAIATVEDFLHQMPDAGILLCSDDGATLPSGGRTRTDDLHRRFKKRFGERVVWTTPRSIDRREPAAIQDAVADLWLLRATDAVVGTAGSSFSVLAGYGRDVPQVQCRSGTPVFNLLDRVFRLAGVDRLAGWLSRRRHRTDPHPIPRPGTGARPLPGFYAWMGRRIRRNAPAFDSLLNSWWSERNPASIQARPFGAIVYLVRSSDNDVRSLVKSLLLLKANFLAQFSYPVILFVESDFRDEWKVLIRAETGLEFSFEPVAFELPGFLDPATVPPFVLHPKFDLGYRHMCRFFSGTIYRHPALRHFRWYWRLDTDSFVLSPVKYDVFQFMERRNFVYGYNCIARESARVAVGFWDLTRSYLQDRGIRPFFLQKFMRNGEWDRSMYYTNFEISRLDFWRSKPFQDYFDAIDKSGGIYQHRWGDNIVHAMAVPMFVPERKAHRFKDIHYMHQRFLNDPNPLRRVARRAVRLVRARAKSVFPQPFR